MCEACGCGEGKIHDHTHMVLPVQGMSCAHCEKKVEEAVGKVTGISHVHADAKEGTVSLGVAPDGNLSAVKQVIKELGFDA